MDNINEIEKDFLNNSKSTQNNNDKKANKNIFFNILYYCLAGVLWFIYFIVCIFCTFIEILFGFAFIKTAFKTTRKKKRRKIKIL